MGVKVKAKARGFYGQLREIGEEFEVADKKSVGTWMDPVGEVKAGGEDETGKAALLARAKELGIDAKGTWGMAKLHESIAEAEAEAAVN